MSETPVSYHDSVNQMYERVKQDRISNVQDRYEAQEKVRCQYCVKGTTCQLCSLGPCRITPKSEKGACGIGPDSMAMRNLLQRTVMGIAAYTYHANDVAKTIKATARGNTPFTFKDAEKIKFMAKQFGIEGNDINTLAEAVADRMIAEINRDGDDPSPMVEIFAPQKRKELWKKYGILPGGPLHEMMSASTSAMTNVDGNHVSLALKALRLGLACTYGSLINLELGQDALFGTPSPHEIDVDMGVLDKDYVNILPNGHELFIGAAIIKKAHEKKYQEMAKAAGAKGIHVIGSIETGQEILQRFEMDDVFVGFTGNWLNQEFVLATGAVDLFAADMNCTVPTLGEYAEKYRATVVPVSKLVAVSGADKRVDYDPAKVEEQAAELIEIAINNFRNRKGKETHIPENKKRIIAGISTEAVLKVLGGSLNPLLDVIKSGAIKGVVALISCTTLKNGPQDAVSVAMAKELIKNDILVISAGCGNGAMQVAGLTSANAISECGDGLKAVCTQLKIPPVLSFGTCTDTGRIALLVTAVADALGVDTSQLPVAVTAPEYLEQKAVIDAFFAVAFGLYTHVSPVPAVTGAPELVKLLTEDVEGLLGGKIAVGDDPIEAAQGIIAHIEKKRRELGIAQPETAIGADTGDTSPRREMSL